MNQIPPQLEHQIKVSQMLGRGFAFSLIWLGGIGSFWAVILGWRARKIILQSGGEISGIKMAWWCIIVGVLGTLIIIPITIASVLKVVK